MAEIPDPEQFAGTLRAKRYPCKTCNHPARLRIERARENGVSYESLSRWLQEFFPPDQQIRSGTLTNHFVNGHDKRT